MHLDPVIRETLAGAVEGALTSLLPSDNVSLSDASSIIYGVVQDTLQRYSRRANNRAAVNNLPAELFIDIVARTSLKDAIAASHVCQFWRQTLLESADLWASLYRPPVQWPHHERNEEVARTFLERTGRAPVTLGLLVRTPTIIDIIDEHLHHASTLDIYIQPSTDQSRREYRVMQPLVYALQCPAPLLEDVHIIHEIGYSGENVAILPRDIFAGNAGRLTTVVLHNVPLPADGPAPAFARLKELALLSRSSAVPSAFEALMSHILEYRSLRHVILLGTLHDPLELLDLAQRRLGGLQLDILEVVYATDARRAFEVLWGDGGLAVRCICAHNTPREDVEWLMSALSAHRTPVSHIRFATMGHMFGGIEIVFSDGHALRTTYNPDRFSEEISIIPSSVYQSLSSLSIHEHMWPSEDAAGLPPAPVLRDLQIFMGTHHNCSYSWDYTGIFQRDTQARKWRVPSLDQLRLSALVRGSAYQPRHIPITVSTRDVVSFIQEALQFSSSRLRGLTLSLVSLYGSDACKAMDELFEVVEEVRTVPPAALQIPKVYRTLDAHVSPWMLQDFAPITRLDDLDLTS
ncbi:hypothetical protein EXIGLDRAFT_838735 [Exidia glandulosa HHB12029]|uniref:F-box domain-containing protein n=1 Tax=Exidia glandulosa HHB12029 TaxID=1314781 RepID=A0A165FJX1_EXIGL|nr:hypothetical protein EXIGLDRAFT_838735 [Exidia glandulosa HHB12029]